jgi:hypothetical protein
MYTLLHTDAIEDTMMDDYYEYCYSEQVLVHGRCVITSVPESIQQLQTGYQFSPLGNFSTKEEAEQARDNYIKYGTLSTTEKAPPIISDPEPVVEVISALPAAPRNKLQKIMQDQNKNSSDMQIPWFGTNLKIVQNKNSSDMQIPWFGTNLKIVQNKKED